MLASFRKVGRRGHFMPRGVKANLKASLFRDSCTVEGKSQGNKSTESDLSTVDEFQMACRRTRQSGPFHVHGSHSEDSGEQSTQEDELDPLKAAQNIVNKFKATRETSRAALEAEHKKEVKDTAAKINALFESRKKKVTKSRKEIFARLADMNKKRQAIESQILSSMRNIEIHSANITNELDAMFAGRLEEMEEHITTK